MQENNSKASGGQRANVPAQRLLGRHGKKTTAHRNVGGGYADRSYSSADPDTQ